MRFVSQIQPSRPLLAGVFLLIAVFLCGAWITVRSYTDLHIMVGQELELRFLSGQLLYLQEQMTKSARLAAETGAPEWEDKYRNAQKELETALQHAVAVVPATSLIGSTTWVASAALTNIEAQALAKLRQGERDKALALLSSVEYEKSRQVYVQALKDMGNDMLTQAQQRLEIQRKGVLAASLLGLALMCGLGAAWIWLTRVVQLYMRATEVAETKLENTNRELESRVRARTAELSQLNQQLRDEMEQRSKMEEELRQSQKLEAMGRLAAGVSHEINTPIQYVSDSCFYLRQGITDLLALLEKYQTALDQSAEGSISLEQAREAIKKARADLEADFIVEHIPQAATRAMEGLDRVSKIIRSMKELSHPGDGTRIRTNLNRAIESTLEIARNEYKYIADIETDFGDIPDIYCFPGEVNQVILNLIINAAHAIENARKESDVRGHITLRTLLKDNFVVIMVEDDGCGMTADIQGKIFEPFFTTKEIGKGTGQGLALARSIVVEKHRGRITVDSKVGMGSTFSVYLPIEPRENAHLLPRNNS